MSDWGVLGLGGDPVPGDPVRTRELAGRLASLATAVENDTSRLRGIAGDGGGDLRMVGDYAAGYRDALVELPGDLAKLGVGYRRCSEALSTFAGALEGAKQQAGTALRDGVDADGRAQSALREIRYALPADRQAAFASGLSLSDAAVESATTGLDESVRSQVRSAFRRGKTAEGDRDRARRLAEQAARLRGDAETKCVRGIEDALESSGLKNKSWWEKAWDFVSAPFRSWDAFIDLCKNIAMVAGIVAMFISGPIGLAIMAIALVAGALVLLDSIHKATTGKGSWWDVAFNVLGVIPGGRGVISISKLGRGALGLVKAFGRGEGGRLLLGGLKTFGKGLAAKGRNMVTAFPHALSTAKTFGEGALRDPRLFARAFKCRWVGRDPIDMASGEMVMAMTDLTLPGTLPFTLTRTYLSSQRAAGWFGPGWTSPLDHQLEHTESGLALSWVQGMVLLYPHPTGPDTAVMPVEGPRVPLTMDAAGRYVVTDPDTGRRLSFPAAPAGGADPVAVLSSADGSGAPVPASTTPAIADDSKAASPVVGGGIDGATSTVAGWRLPLVAVEDRHGNRIAMAYDADTGDLTLITHSGGYVLDVAAVAGRITGVWLRGRRVTLPGGGADEFLREPDVPLVRYGYDDAGRLTEVVNSTGLPTKFTYDAADRLTSWEDRNGTWYAYTYDDAGRVVRTNGSAGCLDGVITYDPDSRVTVEENSLGAQTRYEFDDGYRMVKVVDPLGNATSYSWDRYDRKLSETNPLGHTTSWSYDDAGHPTTITGPDGAVTQVVYDDHGLGLPVRVIQADGTEWVYERTVTGQPIRVIDPAGNATTYTWSDRGALAAVTDALGNTTTITPDPAGLPAAVTDPTGATTTYERDGLGRLITVTDALGGVTQLVWSVEGDLVQQTSPDGATQQWVYDGERNLIRHVDARGQTTVTEYTAFDLPAARTLADGSRTVFGYDTELRLTAVTNALGDVWSYTYDPAGHLVAETDYTGRTLTYAYDPVGRMVERVNGAGEALTYRRDAVGRVVEELATGPSGEDGPQSSATTSAATFAYDALGRLTSAINPDASLAFTRDALGRVTSETVNGATLTLDLDPLGHVLARTTPAGDVTTWTYGPTGLPESLAAGGHTLAFGHDQLGRETTRTLDTGLTITSAWDAAGRLTEQATTGMPVPAAVDAAGLPGLPAAPSTAAGQRLINRRRWTYRPDGNPVTIDDHLRGTTSYDLDPLGRITTATTPHGVETYTYDANSNPTTASWPALSSSTTADPDSAAAVTAALGERTLSRGQITRAGRTTYTHDARGRVVLRRVRTLSGQARDWQYAWDAHDRLTSVTTPDGVVWRYAYDALGRRVAKQRLTANGEVAAEVTFTWHGSQLVEQAASRPAQPDRGTSTTTWTYAPGTWRPLTQHERTTTTRAGQPQPAPSTARSRFHVIATDLVGTPLELLTPTGAITWTRRATSYGVPLDPTDLRASLCPLRFPGQYYDPETGQNYNHHRTYDPTTATYTTPDPLGLTPGPNPVSYVPNPTTWTDPLGLTPYGGRVPHGFADADDFLDFGRQLRGHLTTAGFEDVTAIFQGSSVTGVSFRTGAPFDVGRVSDFDIALASPSLLDRAAEVGAPLRSGGGRTGPLKPGNLGRLGLFDASASLSERAGRPVNFMIYGSADAALTRSGGIVVP